jgi:hypothetical protein
MSHVAENFPARLLAISLWMASGMFGQVFTATLTGVATDPSFGAIPKATVTATNIATNEKRTTTTSTEGRYTFSQLRPGEYELSAEAPGFKKFVQQGIVLRANDTAELNLALQIGATSETVQVSATAGLLDTQTADQSLHIETNTLANLPINTRSPFAIVWANAGISEAFIDTRNTTGDQNFDRFGMNGGRTESTAILLDGVSITSSSQWNGLYYSPTLEAVQEVQLVRNSYDAQYGRSGGGVFSIVTKGGSAEFHGGAFEFLRNSVLDSNNFFNNKNGAKKPFFARNQFGGYLGGPIWKSKRLFFFGSYEGLRQGSPASQTSSVPTALQRQGDFSQTFNTNGTLQTIYDPFTTQPDGNGGFVRTPFPGNVVPQNRFDPVGAKVMALYPQPNRAGTGFTQSNNWFGTGKSVTGIDRYDARADWSRNDKHTMYFRWSQAWENSIGIAYPEFGIGSGATYSPNPRGAATFGNTFTVSPTMVVNVLIGHGNWTEQTIPIIHASPTQVGLPADQVAHFHVTNVMPAFTLANYTTLGVGNNGQLHHPERTESLQVNASKQWSAHDFKFGFTMELAYQNGPGDGGWLRAPTFSFDQGLTSGPAVLPGATTTGNALASLLLGTGSGGSAPYPAPLAEGHHYYGLYAQDAWRVSSRLTLNYGLRWDIQGSTTDRYDRFSTFQFNAPAPISVPGMNLRGAIQFVNSSNRGMWDTAMHDFAPRVGLAYKLTSKLVFRTGYGIYFVPSLGDENPIGFSTNTPWQSTAAGDGVHPGDPLSNPFPNGFIPAIGKSQGAATGLGQGLSAFPRNHPSGYTQNYSADLQYEITPNSVLEVGYSGNQGRKLSLAYQNLHVDQLPAQYLSLGTQLNQTVANPFYGVIPAANGATLSGPTVPRWRLLVPYPQYTGVNLDISTPGGSSSYNALVVKFTKRFSSGLNFIASYQWSRAIDNTSEGQSWEVNDPGPRDIANWSLERSISAHDIPQALALTTLYELPVGRGKPFGSSMHPVAEAILGGWQVSGLIRLQNGIPDPMSAPGNGFGFAYNPPNITSGSDVSISNRTVGEWFNVNAFSKPAPFAIGSAPRRITQLRQDGVHSADIALMKNFVVREPLKLQFRTEFFNMTNTPQFSAPNTSVGSSTFGQVTSQGNSPRQIQFGLKLSF